MNRQQFQRYVDNELRFHGLVYGIGVPSVLLIWWLWP